MIIFCVFWLLPLEGQNINPFEIQDRLNKDSVATTSGSAVEKQVESSAKNETQEADTVKKIAAIQEKDLAMNPFEIIPRKGEKKIKTIQEPQKILQHKPVEEKNEASLQAPSINNFLFWIILFSFLILAVTLSLDRWYITKLFKSIFNYNLSNLLMRENSGFNLILLILLFVLFLLSGSIFIYLITQYFTGYSGINYFWYSLAAVSAVYIVRHSAMRIFLLIFPGIPELSQYSFTIITFNIVLGIVLLIPNLLMAFSPDIIVLISLIIGLSCVSLVYILRSFRGLLLSFNYLLLIPFHFFLYICAFEIIPILVMYKLIAGFV